MNQFLTISDRRTVSIPATTAQQKILKGIFKEFNFLKDIILSYRLTATAEDIINATNFLRHIGIKYCGSREGIDAPGVVRLLSPHTIPGNYDCFDLFVKLLPECSGDRRYFLRFMDDSVELRATHSFKHSGVYCEVTFTCPHFLGALPCKVHIVSYCDMDDLDNHSNECPCVEAEGIEDSLSDAKLTISERKKLMERLNAIEGLSCDCESFITNDATFIITSKMWNKKKGMTNIAKKIEKEIFKNR